MPQAVQQLTPASRPLQLQVAEAATAVSRTLPASLRATLSIADRRETFTTPTLPQAPPGLLALAVIIPVQTLRAQAAAIEVPPVARHAQAAVRALLPVAEELAAAAADVVKRSQTYIRYK